jgi:hypothetical protein
LERLAHYLSGRAKQQKQEGEKLFVSPYLELITSNILYISYIVFSLFFIMMVHLPNHRTTKLLLLPPPPKKATYPTTKLSLGLAAAEERDNYQPTDSTTKLPASRDAVEERNNQPTNQQPNSYGRHPASEEHHHTQQPDSLAFVSEPKKNPAIKLSPPPPERRERPDPTTKLFCRRAASEETIKQQLNGACRHRQRKQHLQSTELLQGLAAEEARDNPTNRVLFTCRRRLIVVQSLS